MKKVFLFLLVMMLLVAAAGCGPAATPAPQASHGFAPGAPAAAPAMAAPAAESKSYDSRWCRSRPAISRRLPTPLLPSE